MICKNCKRPIRHSIMSGYEHIHNSFMICTTLVEYSADGRIIKAPVAMPTEETKDKES